ncbi:MAG: MltA domain-containing protein [Deltaproteobacteria bacterium]|nr:MltA domain-containing protein [Deltaproteobacteria bacterium]
MKAVKMFGDSTKTGRRGWWGAPGPVLWRAALILPLLTGLLLIAVWIGGCAAPEKHAVFEISPDRYPHFTDDLRFDGLEPGIRQSRAYLQRVPPSKEFSFGADSYSAAHLMRSMDTFLAFLQSSPTDGEVSRFIRDNYRIYRSVGNGPEKYVLFTGYYEPLLVARRQPDQTHRVPILGRPNDLVTIDLGAFSDKYTGERLIGRLTGQTVVPYHERRDIEEEGVLTGKAPVLAWIEDPVDLFFLQIQGSGRILLDSGETLNVHYDSSNGRPYRSIGRRLIDDGKITLSEMSMQRIRSYLAAHPEETRSILNHNPSYVFFRVEEDGPLGFLEVKLTPGRSLALDYRVFPLPALAYIETEKPVMDDGGQIVGWETFGRFVLSQDTGGAIRGPARADLFWGSGPYAEAAAGHMRQKGNLYLMVLKPGKAG